MGVNTKIKCFKSFNSLGVCINKIYNISFLIYWMGVNLQYDNIILYIHFINFIFTTQVEPF